MKPAAQFIKDQRRKIREAATEEEATTAAEALVSRYIVLVTENGPRPTRREPTRRQR